MVSPQDAWPVPAEERLHTSVYLNSNESSQQELSQTSLNRVDVVWSSLALHPSCGWDLRAEAGTFETLLTLLRELADENSTQLRVRTSFLERRTIMLFVDPNRPDVAPHHAVFDNEIAHPHKIDGGMHLAMHPTDVRAVQESRQGEDIPLPGRTGGGSFGLFG
jgi:hypothetical protein